MLAGINEHNQKELNWPVQLASFLPRFFFKLLIFLKSQVTIVYEHSGQCQNVSMRHSHFKKSASGNVLSLKGFNSSHGLVKRRRKTTQAVENHFPH